MSERLGQYDQKVVGIVEDAAAARRGEVPEPQVEEVEDAMTDEEVETLVFDASMHKVAADKSMQEREDFLTQFRSSMTKREGNSNNGSKKKRDAFPFVPPVSRGGGGSGDGGAPTGNEKRELMKVETTSGSGVRVQVQYRRV